MLRRKNQILLAAAALLLIVAGSPSNGETFRYTTKMGWNLQGWNLISFPFSPSPGETLPGPLFRHENGRYLIETNPKPGLGYFLYSESDITIEAEGIAAAPDSGAEFYRVDYPAGWSQIGNPFNYHLSWDEVFIDGVPILSSSNLAFGPIGYFWTREEDASNLGAWKAYWINLRQPVSIAFRPHSGETSLDALQEKYEAYLEAYLANHLHLGGGTVSAIYDRSHTNVIGHDEQGDSVGFTGVALAAFAFARDWEHVRMALKYIEDCENPSKPGWIFRHPGKLAAPDESVASSDMYTMITLGFAAALVSDPPDDVRQNIEKLIENVVARGKEMGWVMGSDATVSPPTGATIKSLLHIYEKFLERNGKPEILGDYEGEGWDRLESGAGSALFNANFEYFAIHLTACRILSAILVDPNNENLDDLVALFYRAVEDDQNTLADILYHWRMGDPLDFAQVELSRFPNTLPNTWGSEYSATDYRWQRSPKSIAEDLAKSGTGRYVEWAGVDYLFGYQLLRYAMENPINR